MSEEKQRTATERRSMEGHNCGRPLANVGQKLAGAVSNGNAGENTLLPCQGTAGAASQSNLRTISERKLLANRANAKKSTGPRTERGKSWSRRNAVKHGLLSNAVLFHSDGTAAEPELEAMKEDMEQRYDNSRLHANPIIEAIVVELFHQRTATQLEQSCLQEVCGDSSGPINLDNLLRYRSKSHRELLKTLAKLNELDEENEKAGPAESSVGGTSSSERQPTQCVPQRFQAD